MFLNCRIYPKLKFSENSKKVSSNSKYPLSFKFTLKKEKMTSTIFRLQKPRKHMQHCEDCENRAQHRENKE